MDPRNRADSQHRAQVGRILPNALRFASRTQFSVRDEDKIAPEPTEPFRITTLSNDDAADAVELATGLDLNNGLTQSLSSEDILATWMDAESMASIQDQPSCHPAGDRCCRLVGSERDDLVRRPRFRRSCPSWID